MNLETKKQKIILHIDFNSFFASVEQQANPFLRGKPIAITGKRGIKEMQRSIVATASKEAKSMGVKTPMPIFEAKRVCPELILLPGDMRKYSDITNRMIEILKNHSDAVEQFSTDEAFADITNSAEDYFGATIIAQIIRSELKKQCGKHCTVSIGIAPNKLVAKLASNSVKPNGLTVVTPKDLISFIDKQPLQNFCGIGKKTKQHLENLGITSVETLRQTEPLLINEKFKKVKGAWLNDAAQGIGDDAVNPERQDPKSIGHSYTFPHDLESDAEIKTNLLALSDKVAWRLRRDKFSANSVTLYVRYSNFSYNVGHLNIQDKIQDGLIIYKNICKILERIRNTNKPIRLLGVQVSNLQKINAPASLFKKDQKMQHTLKACDCIKINFGERAISRAATLNSKFQERASGFNYDHKL